MKYNAKTMNWLVIDCWGGDVVVAACMEKWFADAIVEKFPKGFEVIQASAKHRAKFTINPHSKKRRKR